MPITISLQITNAGRQQGPVIWSDSNGGFKTILQGLGVGPGSTTERWPLKTSFYFQIFLKSMTKFKTCRKNYAESAVYNFYSVFHL